MKSDQPSEERVRSLVEDGADVNSTDAEDYCVLTNVLLWVEEDGFDIKWVKLLINLGADVNYENLDVTPLSDACLTMNPEIVKFMLEKGANPDYDVDGPLRSFSLLDRIQEELDDYKSDTDYFSEEVKEKGIKTLEEIIDLLKQYGATSYKSLP